MNSLSDLGSKSNEKPVYIEGFNVGKEMSKKHRRYKVDILRCESLAALPTATLDRLFHRDYDIVVSMNPLPHSSVLPGPKGPMHFGPPCHTSMTPWMKLLLYSAIASGPLSVILMKGQCLRLLPAPLAGCERALISSWDGSTIGGLGGKFEGNLVKGGILLHCLNSLLLVQPLSKDGLYKDGKIITLDIPLSLRNSDGSPASIDEELGLSREKGSELNVTVNDLAKKIDLLTVGYIRVLRLFKEREAESTFQDNEKYEWVSLSVEFGVPLFSPKLCNDISKRVVSSQLLQTEFLSDHHNAMQDMGKGLQDLCAKYQATGSTAKLLYQKEQPKSPSRQLMNYASGRWNPLVDPSSPISGAPDVSTSD